MKPGDVVTVGLVALAVYLAWCYWQERSRQPRSYYAAGELDSVFL